jgi:hypothetical protein
MRQAFGRGFYMGGALAGAMTASKGKLPPGDHPTEPDALAPAVRTDRRRSYPAPDGKLTFDKLSSVYLSGNRTRDDAPNHIRVRTRSRGARGLWEQMCPAQVYEARGRHVESHAVELRPVRRDHREGRPAHAARRRLGPEYTAHLDGSDPARQNARRRGGYWAGIQHRPLVTKS